MEHNENGELIRVNWSPFVEGFTDYSDQQTWEEYYDVAKFFQENVSELKYGSVELIMRKNQGFHGY